MTATKLHNAVPNLVSDQYSPDQLWYRKQSKILDRLVKWGRIGYVKERGPINKLQPKSIKMVCIGYADDHAGDVYRMYNPKSGRVIATRDITWADWHGFQAVPMALKMFVAGKVDEKDNHIGEEIPPATTPTTNHDLHVIPDDDDKDSLVEAWRKEDQVMVNAPAEHTRPATILKPKRVARELVRLNTYYNPMVPTIIENDENTAQEIFNVQLSSDPGEPKTFHEALSSSEMAKWSEAIKRKVWTPTKLT